MSEEEQQPQAPAKVPRRKLTLVLAALLVLTAAGAAAWYAFGADELLLAGKAEEPKQARKPLFIALDVFTINLKDTRGERLAQIGLMLQVEDPELEVAVRDRLPVVRNEILLLISSKEIEELLTLEGKQKLAQQIRGRIAHAIGVQLPAPGAQPAKGQVAENPVREVLFSQFIVQ